MLIPQAQTAGEKSSEREYVVYQTQVENFSTTILEGIVIDSETGEKIENTSLKGEAHSKIVPLSMKTDNEGYFRTALPTSLEPGLHHFFLEANATAYDNKRITGTIQYSEQENVLIKLNYHPFDLNLPEKTGKMTREWNKNKYTKKETESFTDTRKVVDHYEYKPSYITWTGDTFHSLSLTRDHLRTYSDRTLEMLESRNEEWWLNYCRYNANGRVTHRDMEPNSQQDFEYGFQYFQGFTNWRTHRISKSIYGDTYYVEVPQNYEFLLESGKYKIPVYKKEKYTRWRTKTYEITNHKLQKWKNKEIQIKATPRNGYENEINLQTLSGRNIQTRTGKNTLTPNSPASTKLTINPSNKTKNSQQNISIKAYDKNGRKVQTKQYNLKLKTPPKPEKKRKKINETVTDKKPDQKGNPKSGKQKHKIGVTGVLRDSKTNDRLHHDSDHAKVHVKRQNFNGNSTWTNNTRYEHDQYTYQTKNWTMKLTADANGHIPKKSTAKDSTKKTGLAHKNFKLSREDGW